MPLNMRRWWTLKGEVAEEKEQTAHQHKFEIQLVKISE